MNPFKSVVKVLAVSCIAASAIAQASEDALIPIITGLEAPTFYHDGAECSEGMRIYADDNFNIASHKSYAAVAAFSHCNVVSEVVIALPDGSTHTIDVKAELRAPEATFLAAIGSMSAVRAAAEQKDVVVGGMPGYETLEWVKPQ